MGNLLEGRKGVIFGVANKRSIAWASALSLAGEGAEIAVTYQSERVKENVESLADGLPKKLVFPCDVTHPEEVSKVFERLGEAWGGLDFLVHSIAFADQEDLKGAYVNTSQAGFELALDVSAFSLTHLAKAAAPLLEKSEQGASIVTLTYLGSERVIPRYNVMGVAKAALEASVRYLAYDLGPKRIRVNAVSAGPLNTVAARGIQGFTEILKIHQERACLKRNIEASEVGDAVLFLVSSWSRGITGEVIHVDAGYHVMGV